MAEQIKDSEAVGKPLEATKEAEPVENTGQPEQAGEAAAESGGVVESGAQNTETEAGTSDSWSNLLEPRAIFGIIPMVLIDITGIILVCVALDDFFITDIIAGGYLFVWKKICYPEEQTAVGVQDIQGMGQQRRATIQKVEGTVQQSTQKAATELVKGAKKVKWITPVLTVCEIIPYIGALPLWTFMAIRIVKKS